MGLDISVYKPVIVADIEHDIRTFNLDEYPELKFFKEFIFEKENDYYDLEGDLTKLGYNLDDLDSTCTEYGNKVIFHYTYTKHELYEAYTYLDDVWHRIYFKTKKELLNSSEYEKYLDYLPILKKYGYKPRYKFFASGDNTTYYNLNSAWEFSKKKISVKLVNPSTVKKIDKSISCTEVGYQRKGANKQFYEDDMWDSPCVLLKETLLDHWKKYFSHQTPDSNGGFGSGVEYDLTNNEMKTRFKENIIDKFTENETFVIYN